MFRFFDKVHLHRELEFLSDAHSQMVRDQMQVGGKKRIIFDEIQQIVGADTWWANAAPGQIFPNRYPCGTTRTDASLSFVAASACLGCFFKFCLYLRLPVVHPADYTVVYFIGRTQNNFLVR